MSDSDKAVATKYGVLSPRGFANRWTFYIDKTGKIAAIDKAVKPATSAEDMIAKLTELHVPAALSRSAHVVFGRGRLASPSNSTRVAGCVRPDAPDADPGARVRFRAHGRAEHAAQHRQLTDVRQRVGDRPLEDRVGAV